MYKILKDKFFPRKNQPQEGDDYDPNIIISSFLNYTENSLKEISKMEKNFQNIPKYHLKYLKYDYKIRINRLKEAV